MYRFKFVKYLWIPFIIASIIFYLCCLVQLDNIPEVELDFFASFDKLAHYIMYLGFSGATAMYYVYDKRGCVNMPFMFIGAVIVPILYGGLIEILQDNCFPPRSGDWFDFIADVLGALSAIPVIVYFRLFLLKRQTR